MSLPIRLPRAVRAYRNDAVQFSIRVRQGRRDPQPVDLTSYGTEWTSQIRLSESQPVAATFDVDTSNATVGDLVMTLQPGSSPLTEPMYEFDIQVTGGPVSPQTIFVGLLQVSREITHA